MILKKDAGFDMFAAECPIFRPLERRGMLRCLQAGRNRTVWGFIVYCRLAMLRERGRNLKSTIVNQKCVPPPFPAPAPPHFSHPLSRQAKGAFFFN